MTGEGHQVLGSLSLQNTSALVFLHEFTMRSLFLQLNKHLTDEGAQSKGPTLWADPCCHVSPIQRLSRLAGFF